MKALKSIAMVVGFTIGFIGFCICACEQPTMAEQLRTWGIGIPVMVIGCVVMWIGGKGIAFDA